MNDDVADLNPAFERQHLKQRQHGVAHVVKVKITRVGPEGDFHININLRQSINQRRESEKKAAVPGSWHPEAGFGLSRPQLHIQILGDADVDAEDSMAFRLQTSGRTESEKNMVKTCLCFGY